jgi:hypothetical protein
MKPWWIALAALIACEKDPGEGKGDDTDGADDTDAADTDEAPSTGRVEFTFSEFLSKSAIEGASVTAMDMDLSTDANGKVTFDLPAGERFTAELTADGMVPHLWEHGPVTVGMSQRTSKLVVSETTLALLSAGLGVPIDPTKGHLIVQVSPATLRDNGYDSTSALVGASVTISAGATVSLVEDANPLGFTPGDTITMAGGVGIVVFVNVDPGEVTLTRTVPGGETCGLSYGVITDTAFDDVEVRAGTFTNATYYCH